MKANRFTWLMAGLAIVIAAVAHLLPHPANFTPIGALALFCGASFSNRKWAFIMPIGGLLLSDILLEIIQPGTGFYNGMQYVYASFFMVILLGVMIHNNRKPGIIALGSIAGSVLFFLVSNFGMWYHNTAYYTQDISGLMKCYTLAVPFFRNTLLGDLFFNAIFFGGYYLAGRRLLILQKA